MPRDARIISVSGIYHIVMRGVNRTEIFSDDSDYIKFMDIIKTCKDISNFELYAYCLMNNHFHLLIKVGEEPIGLVVKRICCRYVPYYNKKYERVGTLFQDRYRSECIEDEMYYVNVLRYIHMNPVKAGMCKKPQDYKYSSYEACKRDDSITSNEFTNTLLSPEYYDTFHMMKLPYDCLDYDDKHLITDNEAKKIMLEICKVDNPSLFSKFDKEEKENYCRLFVEKGLRYKQIVRLTGLSRKTVVKYSKIKN